MSVRGLVAAVAAAMAAAAVLSGGAPATGLQSANATFEDPVGDAARGMPDVTSVAVSDRPDGMVAIDSTIIGDLAASGTEIEIFIDIDKATDYGNPETSPFNAEYYAYWRPDEGGDWDFKHWNSKGGGWTSVMPELASFQRAGNHYVLAFHRTEIGDPPGFSFLVLVPSSDVAPSSGKWVYNFGPQVVTPALGQAVAAPSAPVAGKRFTVTIPCTRVETHQPLTDANLSASATVGGVRLTAVSRYAGSHAWLRVTIPRSAAQKVLRLRIAVTSQTNVSASKTLSYRVRRG